MMKGYFRKRGSKWSFTIDISTDTEGKRKQKTVSGFNIKKEAELHCAELITQIAKGEYLDQSKDTLSSFLNEWIETIAKQTYSIKMKEMKTWSRDEFNFFLDYVESKETYYYLFFLINIYTGIRRGEILGLRWKDIDF